MNQRRAKLGERKRNKGSKRKLGRPTPGVATRSRVVTRKKRAGG